MRNDTPLQTRVAATPRAHSLRETHRLRSTWRAPTSSRRTRGHVALPPGRVGPTSKIDRVSAKYARSDAQRLEAHLFRLLLLRLTRSHSRHSHKQLRASCPRRPWRMRVPSARSAGVCAFSIPAVRPAAHLAMTAARRHRFMHSGKALILDGLHDSGASA
jgi:hypothetical protein